MYENRGVSPETTLGESLSAEQMRTLQSTTESVADDARRHLTDVFEVESAVVSTPEGPQGAVSIHPPEAPPITVGIPTDDLDDSSDADRGDLVVDLVATAVGRAESSVGDRLYPAAQ